ncbi:MAG TPA: zf-HC2 domain-containing protein [Dehalococcoidia bacterium]|nr:zf-HC2 domain-containing protein [Dehalococcoidia bacterium]
MWHRGYHRKLSLYLDGQLSAADQERLERHLSGCSSCQRELGELGRVVEGLRTLSHTPAPRDFRLTPEQIVAARPPVPALRLALQAATGLVMLALGLVVIADTQWNEDGVTSESQRTERASSEGERATLTTPDAATALRSPDAPATQVADEGEAGESATPGDEETTGWRIAEFALGGVLGALLIGWGFYFLQAKRRSQRMKHGA